MFNSWFMNECKPDSPVIRWTGIYEIMPQSHDTLLRGFIRETILQEMPLKDVLPFAPRKRKTPTNDYFKQLAALHPEDFGDYEEIDWDDRVAKREKPLKKFFSTKKFNDDAVKLFSKLSVPIYIIPTSELDLVPTGNQPSRLSELSVEKLNSIGIISDEKARELSDAVENGAAVLVVFAASLESNFLPTPWMIVHAMFDNEGSDRGDNFASIFKEVLKRLRKLKTSSAFYREVLTMRSARDENLSSDEDAAAEIITQAILTKGFVFNPTGDRKTNSLLYAIADAVKDARRRFEANIAGRVIAVNVASESIG